MAGSGCIIGAGGMLEYAVAFCMMTSSIFIIWSFSVPKPKFYDESRSIAF